MKTLKTWMAFLTLPLLVSGIALAEPQKEVSSTKKAQLFTDREATPNVFKDKEAFAELRRQGYSREEIKDLKKNARFSLILRTFEAQGEEAVDVLLKYGITSEEMEEALDRAAREGLAVSSEHGRPIQTKIVDTEWFIPFCKTPKQANAFWATIPGAISHFFLSERGIVTPIFLDFCTNLCYWYRWDVVTSYHEYFISSELAATSISIHDAWCS